MTDEIENTRYGRMPLKISRLGAGLAHISPKDGSVSEQQAIELIHWSLTHGVRFFDTAPAYGRGESERRLGLALQGVPRDSYVLQTKVGRLVQDDGSVVFDFSRDGILRSLEESLARLKLDRVDTLLIHDPYEFYQQVLDEALPTLYELKKQGTISGVGVGMGQFPPLWEFARNADVDCFLLAGRYTLLEQPALGFLDDCQKRGIAVVLGGVYNSGILVTGSDASGTYNYAPAPAEMLRRAGAIEAICRRHSVPLRAAAVHFARAHPAATALVLGAVSKEQMADNIRMWRMDIPGVLWDDLREHALLDPNAPLESLEQKNRCE